METSRWNASSTRNKEVAEYVQVSCCMVSSFGWPVQSLLKKFGLTFSLGFATITSTAVLFGRTALNMSASSLILIGAITPLSGILGSLVWPIIQRKSGWSNLRILITLVLLASLIPAYGCLGFVFQGRTHFGGLTTQGEMFGLAVYFGWYPFYFGIVLLMIGRFGIWSIPRIRESVLRRNDTTWRGSSMVWAVFDHRQGEFSPVTTSLHVTERAAVLFVPRSARCRSDIRSYRKHPLCLLFPCFHGLGGCSDTGDCRR